MPQIIALRKLPRFLYPLPTSHLPFPTLPSVPFSTFPAGTCMTTLVGSTPQ